MKVARPKRLPSFFSFLFIDFIKKKKKEKERSPSATPLSARSLLFSAHVQITGGTVSQADKGTHCRGSVNCATLHEGLITLFGTRMHTHTPAEFTISPCRQSVKTLLLPERAFKERLVQSACVWGTTLPVWKSRPRNFKKCATLPDTRAHTQARYATQPTHPPTPLFSHR